YIHHPSLENTQPKVEASTSNVKDECTRKLGSPASPIQQAFKSSVQHSNIWRASHGDGDTLQLTSFFEKEQVSRPMGKLRGLAGLNKEKALGEQQPPPVGAY
ncbi:hypothetical protein VIGAN_04118600, partial [Vigna angularis var. angularis]